MIVKVWLPPAATVWAVPGVMLPFAPALGVMVNAVAVNVATIVWFAVTLVKVYVPDVTAAGLLTPSTSTVARDVAGVRRDRVRLAAADRHRLRAVRRDACRPCPALEVMVAALCENVTLMVCGACTFVKV